MILSQGTILFTAWRVRQLRETPLENCLDFCQKKKKKEEEEKKKSKKERKKN